MHGSLGSLCLHNHLDDLGKQGLRSDFLRTQDHGTTGIERGTDQFGARALGHRYRGPYTSLVMAFLRLLRFTCRVRRVEFDGALIFGDRHCGKDFQESDQRP
jgi:hypothetical protein